MVEAMGRRVNVPLSSRRTGDCAGPNGGGIRSAVGGTLERGTAAMGAEGLVEDGFEDDAMAEKLGIGEKKRKEEEEG